MQPVRNPLADYALTPDMAIVDANLGDGYAEVPVRSVV